MQTVKVITHLLLEPQEISCFWGQPEVFFCIVSILASLSYICSLFLLQVCSVCFADTLLVHEIHERCTGT